MATTDEFLTAEELAAKLKIKVRSVRAWTAQGMPSVPAGRLRRYVLNECLAWLRAREADKQRLQALTAGLHPNERAVH